jgi:TIR domain
MKIFISWSGNVSRAVAVALRQWLPSVLQIVQPYVSSEDIEKGARWSAEIAQQLNETAFGVICVTKDNVGSPWLNFEAGALSKSIDTSRVSPFLLDLRPTDLVGPLSQFQATLPQLEDVTRLVRSINSFTDRPVDETLLGRSVEMWWPELEEQLKTIRSEEGPAEAEPQRESTDMIEELLEITRGIQRRLMRSETVDAPRENAAPYRTKRETLDLERLILAKLEAAFARTHEISADTNLAPDGRAMRVDAIFSPLEAGGGTYLSPRQANGVMVS